MLAQCYVLDTDGFVIPSLEIEDTNQSTINAPQVEDSKTKIEVSRTFAKCQTSSQHFFVSCIILRFGQMYGSSKLGNGSKRVPVKMGESYRMGQIGLT